MKGCIETALNLIIEFVKKHQRSMKQTEMLDYFNVRFGASGISRRQISSVIYSLKRNNYVEIDNGDSVKFTNKAKIKMIDKLVLDQKDHKRRLVSFDIPETKKRQRNAFRRSIKQMGFRQIQKSLWVCDRNIGDMVEMLSKEYRVEEYVAYFVVESSNIENYIAKILSKNPGHKPVERESVNDKIQSSKYKRSSINRR